MPKFHIYAAQIDLSHLFSRQNKKQDSLIFNKKALADPYLLRLDDVYYHDHDLSNPSCGESMTLLYQQAIKKPIKFLSTNLTHRSD